MKSLIFRVLAVVMVLGGTVAVAAPRAEACGGYAFTEEDLVWSAVAAYLREQQSFGGDARIEALVLTNDYVATARWGQAKADGHVTHAVLLKLDGKWQVIGTVRVAQPSSSGVAGSRLSSSPAVVANKR